jgi:mannose-6-phosphate isomerase-like protein (cupin superfamily)
MVEKINVLEKFALFSDHWNPRIAGDLNGQQVRLVKLLGEFTWHKHEQEDELFFVIKGELRIEMRNETVTLKENEFTIVPRQTEHRPVAEKEAWVMLFEPASTLNTGNVRNDFTQTDLRDV